MQEQNTKQFHNKIEVVTSRLLRGLPISLDNNAE
jgi:hypothetical protein